MAKGPLIQSEGRRHLVIAVVMLALLALAATVAWAFVHSRSAAGPTEYQPSQLGDLRFTVPSHWIEPPDTDAPPGISPLYQAVDPASPGRSLRIGALPSLPTSSPLRATLVAEDLLDATAGAGQQRTSRVRIRNGPLMGLLSDWEQTSPDEVRTHHMLAVFSHDGQRYWFIALTSVLLADSPRNRRLVQDDAAILTTVWESLRSDALRPAASGDIPSLNELGLSPMIHADPMRGRAVLLYPRTQEGSFLLLRVRHMPAPGNDGRPDTLDPRALLAAQFHVAHDRDPKADELRSTRDGGTDLHRLLLTSGDNSGLARTLWYAQFANGNAILIDALCEPPGRRDADQRVGTLLSALAGQARSTTVPPTTWAQLLAEGSDLVHEQTRLAVTSPPQAFTASLIGDGNEPVATLLERTLPPFPRDAMPLVGVGRLRAIHEPRSTTDHRWRTSSDGSRFELTLRHTPAPDASRPTVHEDLRCDGRQLSFTQLTAGRATQQWSQPLPAPYLPPLATDIWNRDRLARLQQQPALVWSSESGWRATPCWIDSVSIEDTGRKRNLVHIRPLMSVDEDVLEVADDGRVIHRVWHDQNGYPAGGEVRSARILPLSELRSRYEWMDRDTADLEAMTGVEP